LRSWERWRAQQEVVIASSKLTNFRLQKLEEKVDKHNSVIERTYRLEEQMKVANHRIEDLEKARK
jgi:hypothetical protein